MRTIRKVLVVLFSVSALAGIAWGLFGALHSTLFIVRVVEVADQADDAPVDAQALTSIAAIPVGRVNLFDLDLKPIETRLLSNTWVKEVHLQKRFPQTLSISVIFREPRALLQADNGTLSYIDADGRAFGQVTLNYQPDLPVFEGFHEKGIDLEYRIKDALTLLGAWEKSPAGQGSQISSIGWEAERGYKAWVTYPLAPTLASPNPTNGRTLVELGQEIDADFGVQLKRLSNVFSYLSTNRLSVRQIFADAGKKIVVRTASGS